MQYLGYTLILYICVLLTAVCPCVIKLESGIFHGMPRFFFHFNIVSDLHSLSSALCLCGRFEKNQDFSFEDVGTIVGSSGR